MPVPEKRAQSIEVDQLQNEVPLKDPPELRYIAWSAATADAWKLYTPEGAPVVVPGAIPKEAWEWWMKGVTERRRIEKLMFSDSFSAPTKAAERVDKQRIFYNHILKDEQKRIPRCFKAACWRSLGEVSRRG